MDKHKIEERIRLVASYQGTQKLAEVVTLALSHIAHYDWAVAWACMTVDEYINFGNCGKPYRPLHGKFDVATRWRNVWRKAVEDQCAKMKLRCNWAVVDDLQPGGGG